jgi:HD-GYP domain-containing protein (c-di-GMP phosphodiesterase class II)
MLSTRSYKGSYPIERVIEELETGKGVQFDPKVCQAAIHWIQNNPEQLVITTSPEQDQPAKPIPVAVAAGK